MKSVIPAFLLTMLLSLPAPAEPAYRPEVTNVRVQQRPGAKLVDITYDLADADSISLVIAVDISVDGGVRYDLPAFAFSGDGFGYAQRGNNRHIVWDAGFDMRGMDSCDVRVKITADDGSATPPPAGEVLFRPLGGSASPRGRDEGQPDDRSPEGPVQLLSYYVSAYEVTNLRFAETMQWAIGQGHIGHYDNGGFRRKVSNSWRPETLFRADYGGTAPQSGLTYSGSVISAKAGRQHLPCIYVSWYGAVAYCNYRSTLDGLEPCYDLDNWTCDFTKDGYRLPTEAEWEAAARDQACDEDPCFPWCTPATIDHARGNYFSDTNAFPYDVSETAGRHPDYAGSTPSLAPVASFASTAGGLYDMAGNVAEWCWDWYDADYYEWSQSFLGQPGIVHFPKGPATPPQTEQKRVVRGGSWDDTADRCDATYRHREDPAALLTTVGFRTVRMPE